MSFNSHKSQEGKYSSNTGDSLLRLVTSVKSLANNDQLATWLNKHVFIGNLLFFALVSYGGCNAVETLVPQARGEGFEHQRITKENMDSVCSDKEFYEQKLRSDYSPEKGDVIEPLGAKYREEEKDVYPVFRWACEYAIDRGKDVSQNALDEEVHISGSEASPDYKYTGISLDEYYCQSNFKKFTKATYLNFEDPDSWYCTNTDAAF